MTVDTGSPAAGRRARAGRPGRARSTQRSGLGLGVAMLWFSLLVLIPLAAVVVTARRGRLGQLLAALTNEQTAAAIRLTVGRRSWSPRSTS